MQLLEKTMAAAKKAERKARSMGRQITQGARRQPENGMLKVVAETVPIILDLAVKSSTLVPASVAKMLVTDFGKDSEDLVEQVLAGTTPVTAALTDLHRMEGSIGVYLAQQQLRVWEEACVRLTDLGHRSGLISNAEPAGGAS
jgi:hypothetical protein